MHRQAQAHQGVWGLLLLPIPSCVIPSSWLFWDRNRDWNRDTETNGLFTFQQYKLIVTFLNGASIAFASRHLFAKVAKSEE